MIGSPEQLQKSVSPTSSTEKSLERIKKNINMEINTLTNFKSSRRKPSDQVFTSRNDSKQIKTHLLPDLQFQVNMQTPSSRRLQVETAGTTILNNRS